MLVPVRLLYKVSEAIKNIMDISKLGWLAGVRNPKLVCGRRASNKEVENLQLPHLMLRGPLLVHPLVGQQAFEPDPQLGSQVSRTVHD